MPAVWAVRAVRSPGWKRAIKQIQGRLPAERPFQLLQGRKVVSIARNRTIDDFQSDHIKSLKRSRITKLSMIVLPHKASFLAGNGLIQGGQLTMDIGRLGCA